MPYFRLLAIIFWLCAAAAGAGCRMEASGTFDAGMGIHY